MAKALTDLSQARELIVGREVREVEIVQPQGEDSGYIVIYLDGLRVYADSPMVYSDDSGDGPAAF